MFTYERALTTPFLAADRPNMKKNPRPRRNGRIAVLARRVEGQIDR
jgi:hypothetical protein